MPNYKRTRRACYTAYFTMSSVFSLPPLLFVTLRETYGISYTLLGTLVLTNFCTQLAVDLLFTACPRLFPVEKVVRVMPAVTTVGLLLYAVTPSLLPQFAYGGLLAGTIIFSVASGLSEVLLSPVIAALPSDNPQRDMSKLHSLYAFGVFTVVVVSTAFLKVFGTENWMFLTAFWALLPLLSAAMFMRAPLPAMDAAPVVTKAKGNRKRTVGLALCVACIFFGSCAENAMSNWISGYMENALRIDKAVGDILGMAMFAMLLGIARIGYARFGKRITPILLGGMMGAAVCYLVVAFSNHVILAFIACILTGLCTSMLWPGALILMEEKIPSAGVAAFALMAAGGDLGASIAPQLLGAMADRVAALPVATQWGASMALSAEQVGLKAGMFVCALFPLLGVVALLFAIRHFNKNP